MRRHPRGLIALAATAAALIAGQAAIGSAQAASTVTVAPASPTGTGIGSPFGFGSPSSVWGPYMAFVYKNLPPFSLKPGDTISFDLSHQNDIDIQLEIKLAPTTTNGGDVNAAPPTQIVPNTQLPANPRGNTTTGDYELTFTSQAAFDFAGGGLVISLGNPGGLFASDVNGPGSDVLENNATPGDSSGFFVERLLRDIDGSAPWDDPGAYSNIAGFRLNIADPVPPATIPATAPAITPTTTTPPKKKRCKKKRKHRSAVTAKKCKKKRR
jgi:hypothetical protein